MLAELPLFYYMAQANSSKIVQSWARFPGNARGRLQIFCHDTKITSSRLKMLFARSVQEHIRRQSFTCMYCQEASLIFSCTDLTSANKIACTCTIHIYSGSTTNSHLSTMATSHQLSQSESMYYYYLTC